MAGWWREQLIKTISRASGWRKVRARRIEIDGGKCRACGRKVNLQVHHIRPFAMQPERELELSNLVTLCGRCHILLGHLDNWKSRNDDVVYDADVVKMRINTRP